MTELLRLEKALEDCVAQYSCPSKGRLLRALGSWVLSGIPSACLFLACIGEPSAPGMNSTSGVASPELSSTSFNFVSTLPDVAQQAVGLCCQGHFDQLGVHQAPSVLFCQAAFQQFGLQPVLVHRVIPLQVQYLAFCSVEPHEVHTG